MRLGDITPEYLKQVYMFGIDLSDSDGNPYPNIMFSKAIDIAIDWLETELQIKLRETVITAEKHDYYKTDYVAWSYLRMHWIPIISVEKVIAMFPNDNELIQFPNDWFVVYNRPGQVQMVPTQGSFANFLIGRGGQLASLVAQLHECIPGFFRVDYTAGFENDDVPENIADVICKHASAHILHNAGDMVAGSAGVANFSLGLDGLSQSIGTTASPTNAGYGARILNWRAEIKKDLESLKAYWRGMKMAVI